MVGNAILSANLKQIRRIVSFHGKPEKYVLFIEDLRQICAFAEGGTQRMRMSEDLEIAIGHRTAPVPAWKEGEEGGAAGFRSDVPASRQVAPDCGHDVRREK
jgi:hypothetical protein